MSWLDELTEVRLEARADNHFYIDNKAKLCMFSDFQSSEKRLWISFFLSEPVVLPQRYWTTKRTKGAFAVTHKCIKTVSADMFVTDTFSERLLAAFQSVHFVVDRSRNGQVNGVDVHLRISAETLRESIRTLRDEIVDILADIDQVIGEQTHNKGSLRMALDNNRRVTNKVGKRKKGKQKQRDDVLRKQKLNNWNGASASIRIDPETGLVQRLDKDRQHPENVAVLPTFVPQSHEDGTFDTYGSLLDGYMSQHRGSKSAKRCLQKRMADAGFDVERVLRMEREFRLAETMLFDVERRLYAVEAAVHGT